MSPSRPGADGVGHGGAGQAGHGDNIPRERLLDRLAAQTAERQQLADAAALDLLAFAREGADRHAGDEAAGFHPAGEQAPEEGVGLDQDGEELRRLVDVGLRRRGRHMLDDLVE